MMDVIKDDTVMIPATKKPARPLFPLSVHTDWGPSRNMGTRSVHTYTVYLVCAEGTDYAAVRDALNSARKMLPEPDQAKFNEYEIGVTESNQVVGHITMHEVDTAFGVFIQRLKDRYKVENCVPQFLTEDGFVLMDSGSF